MRPDFVSERKQFGHWECDLIQFRKKFGKVNVTSIVERVSRFTVLLRNKDRQSEEVMTGISNALTSLPFHAACSITFDRGTEFSAWPFLQAHLGVEVWLCEPHAPRHKGTVENTNLRTRYWLPRDTDPAALTNQYLVSICDRLNATPRKCLGYRTPAEVFKEKTVEMS